MLVLFEKGNDPGEIGEIAVELEELYASDGSLSVWSHTREEIDIVSS